MTGVPELGFTNLTTTSSDSIQTFSTTDDRSSSNILNANDQAFWPFRLITRYPRSSLIVTFSLQLVVWIITVGLAAAGKDVVAVKFDSLPIKINNDTWNERAMAATSARLGFKLTKVTNSKWHEYSPDWISRARIDLMYRYEGNILTEEPMAAIRQFEKKMNSHPEIGKFFHYISFFAVIPDDILVLSNSVVKSIINYALKNKTLAAQLPLVFPPTFKHVPRLYSESIMIRTLLIPKSWPIYASQAYKRFVNERLRPFLSAQGKNGTVGANVHFSYWSLLLYQYEVSSQGLRDSLFAIGSFIFILLILLLHTRSPSITAAALYGILSALLSANLIYRYVLGRRFIGVFHAISIFLLLGIGADDVFILFDAWRDSLNEQLSSEAQRISWLLKKAGAATFFTSLTSALAFLINGTCEVPLVSTFGLFTGIAVLINYFIAVTFLPIVFHNVDISCQNSTHHCCKQNSRQDKRLLAKFFEEHVLAFLQKLPVKIGSLIVCGILAIIFIWQATALVPTSSILTQMFKEGSNFPRAAKMAEKMSRENPIEVMMAFGIDHQDLTSCAKDDFTCYGDPVWRTDFDLNSPEAQRSILNFCRRLRTDLTLRVPLYLLPSPQNSSENYIRCFVDDMERDMNKPRFQKCPKDSKGPPLDLRIPISRKKIERLVQCYPSLFAKGSHALSTDFSRAYEAALSWWLHDSNSSRAKYSTEFVQMTFKGGAAELGIYGGRIRFAAIGAMTRFKANSVSFFSGIPIRERWEAFVSSQLDAMPTVALRRGFQCTQALTSQSPLNFWEWFSIQEALWRNAKIGLLVGIFGVAFPVLFLATRNIILTLAGVVCLAFATGGVITVCNAAGWELGVCESINFALVTGLSVDYVVHFVAAYHQARSLDTRRVERVRYMLVHVGGAVSSGVITTLGAVSFLFGSELLVFVQFGAFLGSAIFFAFFAAIFLLTPFLLLFGPEQDFGSLDPLLQRAWRRIKAC